MRLVHMPHSHGRPHKFTYSGLLFGSVLLLFSLVYYLDLSNTGFDPLSVYIFVVPGIALILRSIKPPMGFLRLSAVLVGGALVGTLPLFFIRTTDPIPWIGIGVGLTGVILLGASFTIVVKQHHFSSLR